MSNEGCQLIREWRNILYLLPGVAFSLTLPNIIIVLGQGSACRSSKLAEGSNTRCFGPTLSPVISHPRHFFFHPSEETSIPAFPHSPSLTFPPISWWRSASLSARKPYLPLKVALGCPSLTCTVPASCLHCNIDLYRSTVTFHVLIRMPQLGCKLPAGQGFYFPLVASKPCSAFSIG